MNIERLRALRERILTVDRRQFSMMNWIRDSEVIGMTTNGEWAVSADCGTSACLAGWTCIMWPLTVTLEGSGEKVEVPVLGSVCSLRQRAMELLELDDEQADALFEPWNEDLRNRRLTGISSARQVTREWAARVIDRLIETGIVDWDAVRP